MKSKKEILEHVIEIFYEGLIISEINLKYIEVRGKELGDKESIEYQTEKMKLMKDLEIRLRQIDIAKEMLKNYD